MIRRSVALLALAVLAAGCDSSTPSGTPTSTSSTPTTHAPLERATEPPRPQEGRCYQLNYDDAVAPTTDAGHVSCGEPHTARTFYVGTIDAVVDGHLLAVDSRRVQDDIAAQCTRRLADDLGGSADDLALSMFRAVWFSPSVEQSDAGASWFRCDVIALAREDELAALPRHLSLDDEGFGTCGTAEPGSSGFERVICSEKHSWRAIAVVRHRGTTYPGAQQLTDDQASCEDPARAAAADPLTVVFSYLAPTRAQWNAGQHYGTCWVPTT